MARGFSITIGLVVGIIANILVLQISIVLFPELDGPKLTDSSQISESISQMPATQQYWVFTAHVTQAAVGAFAGGFVSRETAQRTGLMIGSISAVLFAINLTQFVHPVWFWLEIPACLILGVTIGRVLRPSVRDQSS